jgi:hypothetical protein
VRGVEIPDRKRADRTLALHDWICRAIFGDRQTGRVRLRLRRGRKQGEYADYQNGQPGTSQNGSRVMVHISFPFRNAVTIHSNHSKSLCSVQQVNPSFPQFRDAQFR